MSGWQIPVAIALMLLLIFFDEPTLALIVAVLLIFYIIFSSKAVKEDFAREYEEMEKAEPESPTYKDVEEHLEEVNEMLFEDKKRKGTSLERFEKGVAKAKKRAGELFKK
mgnify:CR=1 FL=1